MAEAQNVSYIETSAKSNHNIDEVAILYVNNISTDMHH